jgi:hypothetical protein
MNEAKFPKKKSSNSQRIHTHLYERTYVNYRAPSKTEPANHEKIAYH